MAFVCWMFGQEKYHFICRFLDCQDMNHGVLNDNQMAGALFNHLFVFHGTSLDLEIKYFQTQSNEVLLFFKTFLDVQKLSS